MYIHIKVPMSMDTYTLALRRGLHAISLSLSLSLSLPLFYMTIHMTQQKNLKKTVHMYVFMHVCVQRQREREREREDESSDTIVKLANLLHLYSLSGTHISKCHHQIHTFMLAKKKKQTRSRVILSIYIDKLSYQTKKCEAIEQQLTTNQSDMCVNI